MATSADPWVALVALGLGRDQRRLLYSRQIRLGEEGWTIATLRGRSRAGCPAQAVVPDKL